MVTVDRLMCDHEEADTQDAAISHITLLIHSPDTDVALMGMYHAHSIGAGDLLFGSRGELISLTKLRHSLPSHATSALFMVHALTG